MHEKEREHNKKIDEHDAKKQWKVPKHDWKRGKKHGD
jgi:hypothetical protein